LKAGLVSVSFRNLEPKDIIDLCLDCSLQGIEWGADVHVPAGDLETASLVSAMTKDAGLSVAAYGSYYFLGSESKENSFEDVLETAATLGAPVIRIWAGSKASFECTEHDWQEAIEDSRRVADMAANENIRIAYEYHQGTLTDSNDSVLKLLNAVNHPNVYTFWQPPNGKDLAYCLAGLQAVIDTGKLSSLHVFHWWPTHKERHLLQAGSEYWSRYLQLAQQAQGDRFACLEFTKNDDPANTRLDAATLVQLITEVSNQ